MQNKLFVGGLSWDTSDESLKNYFSQIGTVTEAVVIKDKFSGKSKGFGFVTFESENDAKTAIEKLNETELDGRMIRVSMARPKEDNPRNNRRDYNNQGE